MTTPKKTTPRTNKPPPTAQGQTGDSGSSTNTAAIVVPIMVILAVGAGAVIGLFIYRRHKNDPGNLEILTPEGSTPTGSLTFGRGGVVSFMNKVKGGKAKGEDGGEKGQETTIEGLSNPMYGGMGASVTNPTFESTPAASHKVVLGADHADHDA
jgi:hypothetical protein